MQFRNIHFTHGIAEFGKDFIAQRDEGGRTLQYVFQSKVGDIGLATWRDVRAQLFEAITNELSHPGFDTELPRRVVLVTNGRLVGNAPLEAQQFSKFLTSTLNGAPLITWDRDDLIGFFERYGPERVHASQGREDFGTYGEFFRLYGEALAGTLSERRVELYSQSWLTERGETSDRIILAVLEAELLGEACIESGLHYPAFQAALAAFRAIAAEIHRRLPSPDPSLISTATASMRTIANRAELALAEYPGDVLDAIKSFGAFVSYPVHCARALDLYAVRYMLSESPDERVAIGASLKKFVETEMGAGHPISDWYAVSIVAASLSLADAGHAATASNLVRAVAIWIGDRYENESAGLARMDADEDADVLQLLAGPFSAFPIKRQNDSLLATAILDLSCYLGEGELYASILHDLGACGIVPIYFQPRDTAGQFLVEGRDVVVFPNIDFALPMPSFLELRHGEHLLDEPLSFALEPVLGPVTFLLLSLLLRDRYFPTLWQKGRPSNVRVTT
jgi:hypothetical protein